MINLPDKQQIMSDKTNTYPACFKYKTVIKVSFFSMLITCK